MPAERRERAIAIVIGSTGNGRNPMFNGRRQPSCGGTSRMTRECQVRICERLGVNSPGLLGKSGGRSMSAIGPLMLDEQTSVSAASRSGLGHKRTHAPQQNSNLFDHL